MSEVALFFEKMHKVFKNKAQRCSTPLTVGRISRQRQRVKGLMQPGNTKNHFLKKNLHSVVLNLTVGLYAKNVISFFYKEKAGAIPISRTLLAKIHFSPVIFTKNRQFLVCKRKIHSYTEGTTNHSHLLRRVIKDSFVRQRFVYSNLFPTLIFIVR